MNTLAKIIVKSAVDSLVGNVTVAGISLVKSKIKENKKRQEEQKIWDAYYKGTRCNLMYYWDTMRMLNNFEIVEL